MKIFIEIHFSDADRQGESNDVSSWPPWCDPRARSLIRPLLLGLAAKIVSYNVDGVHGLPASVRAAIQFLRGRGYPMATAICSCITTTRGSMEITSTFVAKRLLDGKNEKKRKQTVSHRLMVPSNYIVYKTR